MSKKPKEPKAPESRNDSDASSMTDAQWGPGVMADGSVDSFPPSELAARIAKRDEEERAYAFAMDYSDAEDNEPAK